MADVKITGLPAGTLDTGDLLEFVDITDGISRKGEWINHPVKEVFDETLTNPNTTIPLPSTPSTPATVTAFRNGAVMTEGAGNDFTVSGSTLTLLNAPFAVDQHIEGFYNDEGGGAAPVSSIFGRTGVVVAQGGDYAVAQITGAAASGANSDITALSGLTTALSIAQGGTNSAVALVDGKVMASSAGKIIESAVDISSLGDKSILTFGANSITSTTTTRYLFGSYGDSTASTSIINMVLPYAATVKNLHVYHNTAAGNGNDIDYTVFKNGVSTALTVTLPSTTTTGSDTSNTVAFAAGDRIAIEVIKALAIGGSPSDIYATVEVG